MFEFSQTVLWKRLASALVASFYIACFSAAAGAADEVPVCGVQKQDFLHIAFPKNSMNAQFGGGLIKWATTPGLIVLAAHDRADLSSATEAAFKHIERDGLIQAFHSEFVTYESIQEASAVVDRLGSNNVFVFLDRSPFEGEVSREFEALMSRILQVPRLAEVLIRNARRGETSVNNLIELVSSNVVAASALVDPRVTKAEVTLFVYTLYYKNLVPNSRALGDDFNRKVFTISDEDEASLTDYGQAFFKIIAADDVKPGMKPSAFVDCNEP